MSIETTIPVFCISKRRFDAVIFDLDGVITRTAKTHMAAWQELFDTYLKQRSRRLNCPFEPFDPDADYRTYVDGKPRYEGLASFLTSRGIHLPYGRPDDLPDQETICGLGNRKNQLFRKHLEEDGVEVFGSTLCLIDMLRASGILTAVVSSSKNCVAVLKAVDMLSRFKVKIDGNDAERLGLKGKPAPDIFLEAAGQLDVEPARAVVVEDAIAGVQAGRRGGFGCVIGVDRSGQAESLKQNGADVVVGDLVLIAVKNEYERII
jgi:alpha,alpha-trehalase